MHEDNGGAIDRVSDDIRTLAERIGQETSEVGRWIEIMSAFLLSAAVVLSAFSAWQATLWGGKQSIRFAEATAARTEATNDLSLALTQLAYDAGVFADGIQALVGGDEQATELYEERIYSDEFKKAYDAWLALDPFDNPDAPESPFDLEEYELETVSAWIELEAQASEKFEAGKEANSNGDDYILATVFFASVLFFAGISTKFKSERVRSASVVIATVALIGGIAWLISLPRLEIGF